MEDYRGWFSQIKAKEGVRLETLKPEIRIALKVAFDLYSDLGKQLVVTSTNDGKHKTNSKHYKDQAFDTRVWGLTETERQRIVKDAQDLLGKEYFVLDEINHLHFQYNGQ